MNVHLPHHIQMVYFRANSDTNFAKLPKSKQNYSNLSKMAQIWPEYLITGLKSIILAPWILAFETLILASLTLILASET